MKFVLLFCLLSLCACGSTATRPDKTLQPIIRPPDTVTARTAASGKAKIEDLARGNNAFFGRLTLAAGASVPVHRDATEETLFVIAGSGTIIIEQVSYRIGPGYTIFMPAGAEVSFQNDNAEFVALQIFATPEPASKYESWN